MVNMKTFALLVFLITLPYMIGVATANQCGRQAGGAHCPGGLCCSQYGYCGSTSAYCGRSQCQSQCMLDMLDKTQAQQAQDVPRAMVEAATADAP
ncbi:hypothetical protein RND81_11G196100 [Saponaria officinalis]|uniref:Chitin-binding type-1 domain-containing protein n=1 Tax=Saponaria officinalis TaxID=3572 RepID=A0AAW1HP11_SAPOF